MIVKHFIDQNHDLEARDRWGKLPSQLAREKGFTSIALMLEILIRRKHLPPVPIHYLQELYYPNGISSSKKLIINDQINKGKHECFVINVLEKSYVIYFLNL